jgi:hypothetical protein
MKKDALIKYCEEKEIWLPKGATLPVIVGAIARHALNGRTLVRKSCFGLWAKDDNNCLSCDHAKACFTASIGMDEDLYWKKVENADKLRFKG